MSEEKRPRGRPRIHETNAARKKAYRERKKEERLQMEKRIKELESKLAIFDSTIQLDDRDDLLNLTYLELDALSTEKLESYLQELKMRMKVEFSIYRAFNIILESIEEFQKKAKEHVDELIISDIDNKFQENREQLQYALLQQMIEYVLAKKQDSKYVDHELELIEQRIMEIEKRISQDKEIKKEVITKKE
ncbi:MAG: hypothetical protein FK730_06240 [Asgard group archaeon]|nr:hypothetical protein [Asgard group archaeon]